MAKKRKSGKMTGKKWLVRAGDNTLYVISENKPPVPLTGRAASNARKILDRAEGDLSTAIPETIPTLATGISLAVTEAFGHN